MRVDADIVGRCPDQRFIGQLQPQRAGTRQAGAAVGAGLHTEREVVVFQRAAPGRGDFPQHRHGNRCAGLLQRRGHGQRRHHADRQQRWQGAVATAQRAAHGFVGSRLLLGPRRGWRQQGDPQGPVGAVGKHVDALGHRPASGKHRCGLVGLQRAVDLVDAGQALQQLAAPSHLGGQQAALDVGLAHDRQHRRLGQGFERQRGLGLALRRQRVGGQLSVLREGQADDAARRQRGPQALAQQLEEHQPLALGDQVGTVEQRIAQPGEQLDQRAAGVAQPRVGPFRRVRGDAGEQVFDQVVEAAVVE